ncbi:hypothetical protein OE88DRAFT_1113852 [Heliocybe sulcata]|uniref:DUF1996 domain-containing protein n=1 Tax=Heliocybe sulcata TaxID=5364 RepID=A0A5C3ML09_9AGAM|nr:hypothetical protein OE88DRAFT_1113852 [Heliocybe sulcata]
MLRPAFISLLAILSASGVANAWFRVACTNPLVQERIDPILNPGQNPSQHAHTIQGASNFNPNYDYNNLRASTCTSCEVAEDLSNYWYPKLYFHDRKANTFTAVENGGLLVYYQNRGDDDASNNGPGLKAFPAGFRMITGNPMRRSKQFAVGEGSQGELRERAVQWSCLRYGTSNEGYDNTNGTGFPWTDCEAGFNARLHMPACWDGVNLYKDDQSHVAYLSEIDNGSCPPGYPVGLMKLFYEVTWNVHEFANLWDPSTESWPFVYATGDPTGYSWHGDFQNGWDTTALQNAIDHCNNPNDQTGSGITEACSYLTVTSAAVANACKITPIVNEQVNGTLTKLPGCNPLQTGPADATMYTSANCPSS